MAAPDISIIVPMYNETDVVDTFFKTTLPILDACAETFEVICVDDGSQDDTAAKIRTLERQDARIKLFRLSRNFGKEIAMTAGLDHAKGQAVIFMDADLQDPPELIQEFIKLWKQGYENIYGLRVSRDEDSFAKKKTASMFYRVFNKLSKTPIPRNAGDYRLLGPSVVAALRACREKQRFMKGLYGWVGFASIAVPYERPARSGGQTKFNSKSLFLFALDGIFGHSIVPLRVASLLGAVSVLFGMALGIWLLIDYAVWGNNPNGFYLTIFVILGFSAVNLITLGILGEYIWRIYDEVKDRPLYFLRHDEKV